MKFPTLRDNELMVTEKECCVVLCVHTGSDTTKKKIEAEEEKCWSRILSFTITYNVNCTTNNLIQ
jgi:hypothetical protein